MIEVSILLTILYTDHIATIQIVIQISITTISLVCINTRYIYMSEYLSYFRLEVRYKPKKKNIVLDALSRLEHILVSSLPIVVSLRLNPLLPISKPNSTSLDQVSLVSPLPIVVLLHTSPLLPIPNRAYLVSTI
jgi:hypothetical protein